MDVGLLLDRADAAYYGGEAPLMSDADYDRLARLTGHQSFTTAELPSLNNARCPDDLFAWVESIPLSDRLFHLELKVDGVSVLVRYENGQPVEARTRKLSVPVECLDLPRRPDGFSGTARGEAWHPRGRGFAAGRLRARDASAGLLWMPFCASVDERNLWPIEFLSRWHITTDSTAEILECWAAWKGGEIAPGVPSDGLVITVADPPTRSRLGCGKRAPRYSLALK